MNVARHMNPLQLQTRFEFLLKELDQFPEDSTDPQISEIEKELNDITEIVFGLRFD